MACNKDISRVFAKRAHRARIADRWTQVLEREETMKEIKRMYMETSLAHADSSCAMMETFPNIKQDAYQNYINTLYDFAYSKIAVLNAERLYAEAQDAYNEAVIAYEDWVAALFSTPAADDEEEEEDDDKYEEVPDVYVKVRKTRKDVLTPDEAIKSCKSSKMHKMKPRKEKRDRTKTKDEKERAQMKRVRYTVVF